MPDQDSHPVAFGLAVECQPLHIGAAQPSDVHIVHRAHQLEPLQVELHASNPGARPPGTAFLSTRFHTLLTVSSSNSQATRWGRFA